jgi:hypothetical protein
MGGGVRVAETTSLFAHSREFLCRDEYRRYMRIAFLILNHRAPPQLLRLLATLRRQLPEATIVVHHDRFRTDLDTSTLDPIGNAHLLTSEKPIMWGEFSVVEAYWRSMAWMIEHVEFDWVIMLSAQDYPIKSLATLGDYLAATCADVLLQAVPISELSKAADRRDKRHRYLYQYRPVRTNLQGYQPSSRLQCRLLRSTGPFLDVLNNVQPYFQIFKFTDRMPSRFGWRARSTPFTEKEPCMFGSLWKCLSYRAAEFVVTCARDRPDYVDYYRRTVIPGESATATLVCNTPGLRVDPHDLHYTRWTTPKTSHPDIFTIGDLAELVAAPQYFARKFDLAKDAEILDKLDEVLARAAG